MSQTLEQVRALVVRGEVQVAHGYEELAADQILVHEVVDGVSAAVVVEDYPEFPQRRARCLSRTDSTNRCMLSGVFRRSEHPQQFSLLRTGQIRQNGTTRGSRDEHERQGKQAAGA